MRLHGFLCLATLLPAQSPSNDLAARAKQLVELALDQGRAHELLASLTKTAPHRLSGSAGAARAVEWAVATMRELGLDAVRREKVLVPRWVRGEVQELSVLGADGARTLPILALGGSVATPPEGITAELVGVRSFEELEALGDAARGKIVLFHRPMPRALASTFQAYSAAVPQRSEGAIRAARAGAVAVLVRSMTTSLDDFPHTGALHYAGDVVEIPAAAVSTNGTEELVRALAKGPVTVRLRLDCATLADVESANVIGEIRGGEAPDEIVLLGAHLDCWDVGEGAHDDGAGCAHVLEAMRLIRASGARPARTIRAVLFMNEENGLRGAHAYAQAHRAERHVAALETDAGGFEPRGFSTSVRGERRGRLVEIADALRPWSMGALLDGGGGADIGPLGEAGVPLFGLVVTSHRYFDVHHSERDRIDQVNERELALGAAAVAHLALGLASEEW